MKKITSFCQVLKETHAKENWFLFSASRCVSFGEYWQCLHSFIHPALQCRVYETVGRPSICLCVCPSHHSPATAACLLLSAVLAEDISQQRRPLGTQQQLRRHSTVLSSKLCSAANASIVTLTADVGSQTQNCYSLSQDWNISDQTTRTQTVG